MTYQITLEKTVGIYGHDAEGRPWTTFQTFNGVYTCDGCGEDIDRGYTRGKWGEEQLHVCISHVQIVGNTREDNR
jgi:hypothetical protein